MDTTDTETVGLVPMENETETTTTIAADEPVESSKVCLEVGGMTNTEIETVVLLAKSCCTQSSPDIEYRNAIHCALNNNNVQTYFISPITFRMVNSQMLTQFLFTPDRWSGMVLTSTRCIDAVVQCFVQMKTMMVANNDDSEAIACCLEQWSHLKIFTVGETTRAYLLEKLQWQSIGHHTGNGIQLARFIIETVGSPPPNEHQNTKPLLYPCSSIRAESISSMLANANIALTELVCYETLPNGDIDCDLYQFKQFLSNIIFTRKQQQKSTPTINNSSSTKLKLIVIFFSPSGVDSLLPSLQKILINDDQSLASQLSFHFVAFGKSTADRIVQSGVKLSLIASAPNAHSLAHDLVNYVQAL